MSLAPDSESTKSSDPRQNTSPAGSPELDGTDNFARADKTCGRGNDAHCRQPVRSKRRGRAKKWIRGKRRVLHWPQHQAHGVSLGWALAGAGEGCVGCVGFSELVEGLLACAFRTSPTHPILCECGPTRCSPCRRGVARGSAADQESTGSFSIQSQRPEFAASQDHEGSEDPGCSNLASWQSAVASSFLPISLKYASCMVTA